MNYKTEMNKMRKYAHNLKIVMNVFYWVAIIAACGSLLAAVVIKLMPDSFFILSEKSMEHLGFSLDGLIKYNLDNAALLGLNLKNIYITIMIMSTSIFILIIPILKQLVLILKTVEENRPFAIENARRISIFGFILIISSFLIPIFEFFVASTMIDILEIQNVSISYTVNASLILAGFLMFVLSGIFRYGSYLQHEYDETV